jgi:hypothetical protein
MSLDADDPLDDLAHQGEVDALEAELRAALQQQRAAVERVQETQQEIAALMARARTLLERRDDGSGSA